MDFSGLPIENPRTGLDLEYHMLAAIGAAFEFLMSCSTTRPRATSGVRRCASAGSTKQPTTACRKTAPATLMTPAVATPWTPAATKRDALFGDYSMADAERRPDPRHAIEP